MHRIIVFEPDNSRQTEITKINEVIVLVYMSISELHFNELQMLFLTNAKEPHQQPRRFSDLVVFLFQPRLFHP